MSDDELTPNQIRALARRMSRWRILRILYMGRPIGANETIILHALSRGDFEVTKQSVRNELEYLAGLKLISLAQGHTWLAEILPDGVDVVEYTTEAPAGILRPEQQG
jgi:hypothetical protein